MSCLSATLSWGCRREEIQSIYETPLLDLVYRAASVHRMHNDPSMVRLSLNCRVCLRFHVVHMYDRWWFSRNCWICDFMVESKKSTGTKGVWMSPTYGQYNLRMIDLFTCVLRTLNPIHPICTPYTQRQPYVQPCPIHLILEQYRSSLSRIATTLKHIFSNARASMFCDSMQVQRCTLLSIKTGGCPEDCGYCRCVYGNLLLSEELAYW